MNINHQDAGGHGAAGMSGAQAWAQSAWTRAAVVAMTAGTVLAQAEKPEPGSSPLEDTWDYLVELFRMLVGL